MTTPTCAFLRPQRDSVFKRMMSMFGLQLSIILQIPFRNLCTCSPRMSVGRRNVSILIVTRKDL